MQKQINFMIDNKELYHCGVCGSATTKTRHVILDFDMVSGIITFENKGRFGKS